MLKRFISYYKPHRKLFIADMLASLFISLIGMVYPVVTNRMLNDLIPNKNYRMIVIAGIAVLFLYVIRMLLRYFVQYYGHMIGVGMQADMRRDMFTHLEKLPISFFDTHETGRIMSRLTNDLMDISELAHHGPENIIISTIMIIGSFTYLCSINVLLTLIIFTCVPFLLIISGLLRKKMKAAFKKKRIAMAIINASIENSISGIRVTKSFTNSNEENRKFDEGNGEFVSASKKAYLAMAKFFSGTSFITDVFNVIIIIAGGLFLYAGKISFGDYSTFIVSVNLFINPVTTLINFMEQYQNGVTGFQRFTEIMDVSEEIEPGNAVNIEKADGHIELINVTFSYENNINVLDNVSLDIKKGSIMALVGSSGGGKTTICHLIPRLYNLTDGKIMLDGTDISKLSLDSLRKNIGVVEQDVFLFNGTFKDNILYGRPDASKSEIMKAAKLADIHDYIMSLEKGYDTNIGERGIKLSGGQKQRLSIARVFLKNPSVLILDEATSALDNATEMLIQQSLERLCVGRTTIVVAHRLSTVRNADEIAVVEDGHIIEKGTHSELLTLSGTYKKLYDMQFRNEQ